MGFFANLWGKVQNGVHIAEADLRGAEKWVVAHTIVPLSTVAGTVTRSIEYDASLVGNAVKSVGHSIVTEEQILQHGVQDGARAVGSVLKGVGQFVGGIANDVTGVADAAAGGAKSVAKYLPILLLGGGVLFVAVKVIPAVSENQERRR